jgi:hypothetical protein
MRRVSLIFGILVGLTCGTSAQAEGKSRYRHDYRRVHHSHVLGNYVQPTIIILNSSPSFYRNDCCYVHNSVDYHNNAVPRYNSLDYYNNVYKPYYAVPAIRNMNRC